MDYCIDPRLVTRVPSAAAPIPRDARRSPPHSSDTLGVTALLQHQGPTMSVWPGRCPKPREHRGAFDGDIAVSAVGLFRGSRHTIEYMSKDFIEWVGADYTGMPAYEAFPDAPYAPMRCALDDVLATGVPKIIEGAWGRLTIVPRVLDGRVVGVASHYPVRLRDRVRPLRLPVGLLGSLVSLPLGW